MIYKIVFSVDKSISVANLFLEISHLFHLASTNYNIVILFVNY